MEATPGLRERKKQRTREAIVTAAFELFDERGFDGTTIADIAEAAEIAPRTFFSYFPSKDDVVFHDFEEKFGMFESWLSEREPGMNTIDAVRAGVESMLGEADPEHLEQKRLSRRLIRENESLAAHAQHLRGKFAGLLAESIAKDLGDDATALRPRLVAAAATAAMTVIDEMPDDDVEHSMETLDSLLVFLRGGLSALQDHARG
jgi:AcrR family transcriptional regulator